MATAKDHGKNLPQRQIFTFFVEDMMFGLDVSNVLMLGQEVSEIQRLPVEERGFCGISKFQGTVVPVIDFAHRVNVQSGADAKQAVLEQLANGEKEHIGWFKALEHALRHNTAFTESLSADECDLGQWFNRFQTRDETLKELVEEFQTPHKSLHQMADSLLAQRDKGDTDGALEKLNTEGARALRQLRNQIARAKEQIQTSLRQVLLYITTDGKTPRYALLIDDINDVISYSDTEFHSSTHGALSGIPQIENVLEGIYTQDEQPDCLFFDVNKLTDVEQQTDKAV